MSSSTLSRQEQERAVSVAVRIRPPFEDEVEGVEWSPSVRVVGPRGRAAVVEVETHPRTGVGQQREFGVDMAFGAEATQEEVYETVAAPVIEAVLNRGKIVGTVMAYGQTGAGKSYTMGTLDKLSSVGDEEAGMVPRALKRILSADQRVTMSFFQIYRDTIQDLLTPQVQRERRNFEDAFRETRPRKQEPSLQIREHPGTGFYVQGLREYEVADLVEAQALVDYGLENRALAATNANATSSRSHTILSVQLECTANSTTSKVLFVDLAGSERVRSTASKGARLAEARCINASLAALGNVVSVLAEGSEALYKKKPGTHVPFRDSKLTRILQESLTHGRVALLAAVGPGRKSAPESLGTLNFAARCASIVLPPSSRRRVHVDSAAECAKMRKRLAQLEAQLVSQRKRQSEQNIFFSPTAGGDQKQYSRQSSSGTSNPEDRQSSSSEEAFSELEEALADIGPKTLASATGLRAAVRAARAGRDADAARRAAVQATLVDDRNKAVVASRKQKNGVASLNRALRLLDDEVWPDLAAALGDRDDRERRLKSDLESWSLVLEHLVAANEKLRSQLKHVARLYPGDSRIMPLRWNDRWKLGRDFSGDDIPSHRQPTRHTRSRAQYTPSSKIQSRPPQPSPAYDAEPSPLYSQLDDHDLAASSPAHYFFPSPPSSPDTDLFSQIDQLDAGGGIIHPLPPARLQ